MPVINRNSLPAPALPKETVEVLALGGEVVVRGLRLTERLALLASLRAVAAVVATAAAAQAEPAPVAEPPAEDAEQRRLVPVLLAQCVLDDESEPLFTRDEWEAWGGQHQAEALRLFNVAMRLSGFDREGDRKN